MPIQPTPPTRLKAYLDRAFRWQFHKNVAIQAGRIARVAHYFPHDDDATDYSLPAFPLAATGDNGAEGPIPPRDLWVNYGRTPEEYLDSGRTDLASMKTILRDHGEPIEEARRILEIGCAAGRMTRHLADLAEGREIWGVDIWASAIMWCQENLAPPFRFATTTIAPHLPFEDRYFDLIYAGSVFTHIEDLTDAWFLELRRVLRPGGRLYFTINDRRAIEVFEGNRTVEEYDTYVKRVGGPKVWEEFVDTYLRGNAEYQKFRRGEAFMISIARGAASNVMWDLDVLTRRQRHVFRPLAAVAKAYGHQTGALWERL